MRNHHDAKRADAQNRQESASLRRPYGWPTGWLRFAFAVSRLARIRAVWSALETQSLWVGAAASRGTNSARRLLADTGSHGRGVGGCPSECECRARRARSERPEFRHERDHGTRVSNRARRGPCSHGKLETEPGGDEPRTTSHAGAIRHRPIHLRRPHDAPPPRRAHAMVTAGPTIRHAGSASDRSTSFGSA